ncbi:MAG: S41 family peptidase [Anaerolineales bacterium]
MSSKRALLITLLAGLICAGFFVSGYGFATLQAQNNSDFSLLEEALTILESHAYIDPPPGNARQYGMIRGLVSAYNDPYTIFIEPAQHELESDDLRGEFGGVGVRIEQNLDGQHLLYPLPDSPAIQAGIQDGDILLAVDQMEIHAETHIEDIQAALRGRKGTKVNVRVLAAVNAQEIEYTLERTTYPIPSVIWNLDDDEPRLGIIHITRMSGTTVDEIRRAVQDLSNREAAFFVLDLRDNPGGLLDAGIDTARLFLQTGVIIEQQYKDQPVEASRITKPGEFSDLPLAVIVNGGTASAAELVAGAIKAHQRAKIYGQPTYGKDTLQLVFELHDQSSIHVTAAKWWVPHLDPPIGGNGVIPDEITNPDDASPKPEIEAIIRAQFPQP